MSGEPPETDTGIGSRDIQLNAAAPIIHATVEPLRRREPESQQRYYDEKIAELVLTQQELARVVAERDALVRVVHLAGAMAGHPKDANEGCRNICKLVRETKDKLEAGELRRLST